MTSKATVLVTVVAAFGLTSGAWAQASATRTSAPTTSDSFQVHYVSNLDQGDSVVNVSNAGTQGGFDPAGRICVNTYVFSPDEQMVACCSCRVTPNALNSYSVTNDLVSNTLTPMTLTSAVIKLLATVPVRGTCNAALSPAPPLAPGMRAWGTSLHALPTSPTTYGVTETEFSPAALSLSELTKLSQQCSTIQTIGSGRGICDSCRAGGL